jgi:hypothetical protein
MIGLTSIAAPVVGLIVRDLRRPDSLIRRLIGGAATKLLERRAVKGEPTDITDKVEVTMDENDKSS